MGVNPHSEDASQPSPSKHATSQREAVHAMFQRVAKVRAKKDGKLAQAILPLAEVFATPRKKRATTPETSDQ